jgi:hypothetical protein
MSRLVHLREMLRSALHSGVALLPDNRSRVRMIDAGARSESVRQPWIRLLKSRSLLGQQPARSTGG